MTLTVNEIQRLTAEALRRVRAEYAPAIRQRILAGGEPDRFNGKVREDKYYCEALLTKNQFFDLRDQLNNAGVWLAAPHFAPFGRSNNKFIYRLVASAFVPRAEWLRRRADQSVRCTIELIGEDPANPTLGLVQVVRALADELESQAQLKGQAAESFLIEVEGTHTRGRAKIRRQGSEAVYAQTHALTLPVPAAALAAAPCPGPAAPAFIVTTYGGGKALGFVVCLPPHDAEPAA